MRNYNLEYLDNHERNYAYSFDYLMHDYFMRVFNPFFSGKTALELGCFEGEFTKKILSSFENVTVIEASSELTDKAKARLENRARFILSTFENTDMGNENFDAIFLLHTLEHLDDQQNVLRRIKEWLAPDGKLFIAVPNANAISRQIAVKMELINYNTAVTEGENKHGHRRTYTLDTLEHEIKQSGFNIIDSGGVFFKPFANFQFDLMIQNGIIEDAYLEGCFQLGKKYPDFCASIYSVCTR
jgi:2-polyprenyl-3-methyl-5-hydroxy-6-metoxy-1,4-benzoquinol methylase